MNCTKHLPTLSSDVENNWEAQRRTNTFNTEVPAFFYIAIGIERLLPFSFELFDTTLGMLTSHFGILFADP